LFFAITPEKLSMKLFKIIYVPIIITILFYSCNSSGNKSDKQKDTAYNKTDTINESDKIVDSTSIVTKFKESNADNGLNKVNRIPVPESQGSITIINVSSPVITSSGINSGKDLSQEISALSDLLNKYSTTEFTDCESFEKAIRNFTDSFFDIIDRTEITDSISISSLKQMEGVCDVFEPEFERVEKECPDLYNDYMEYLDDYTDMYYFKLGIMFGETKDE
jgi:hypothetical protein